MMIEVRDLTKKYGETLAVDGVTFGVPQGEILGLLGPNGAGKSTTMRILTGYMPPSSGSARIAGYDVVQDSRMARAVTGYLPESAPVYGEMTVRDYVRFFAEAKGLSGVERDRAADVAIGEASLSHVARRLLMNLSKGYRQRAGLAQAIVGNPKVLILDEPTVGLDPTQIREVRDLIRAMADKRTVILSTHILPEVSLTCSRVVIINQGRVVASGTPENIHSIASGGTNALLLTVRGKEEAVKDLFNKVKGVIAVTCLTTPPRSETHLQEVPILEWEVKLEKKLDLRAELARAVVEARFDLLEIRSTRLSLEDVFIQTIAGEKE
ncbi:TPA: ABC transporter [Candidatus Sumerlaeota bacterium]|jgi:ABC-2 type transport system ATP-binding protein|nr:ABC transporter [Candidatus Sumerlaeota bacterium]